VPAKPIRQLRDLTRYRRSLTRDRTRTKQRLEKVLEDAQIKLGSVVSDVHGVSGRAMVEALTAGQRDPMVLAQLARGSLRGKTAALEEALTGHFGDHHALICAMMSSTIDALSSQIEQLSARIETLVAPFADRVAQLDEISGIGRIGAQEIIAEIGLDMSMFATAAHLVSWAKFCPQVSQSGGKPARGGATGRGDPWLGAALGEAVINAARTRSFLGERYRRLARRRGKNKALVAVGNSMLTVIWHLLSDPDAHYRDLGADFYDTHVNQRHRQRALIDQLQQITGMARHPQRSRRAPHRLTGHRRAHRASSPANAAARAPRDFRVSALSSQGLPCVRAGRDRRCARPGGHRCQVRVRQRSA
jgi:transposase